MVVARSEHCLCGRKGVAMINRLLMRRHTELAIATNNQLQPTHKYCCYNRADLVQCSVVQELEEICFQLYAQTFRLSSGLIKPVHSPQTDRGQNANETGILLAIKEKIQNSHSAKFSPQTIISVFQTGGWSWLEHTRLGVDNPNCEMYRDQQQIRGPVSRAGRAGASTRANRHLLCPDRDLLITKLNPPIQNPQNPISVGNSDLAEKQNQTEYNLSNLMDLGRRKLLMWKICHAQPQLQL